MNTRRSTVFTIFTLLLIGLVANAASHASTSFRLTVELRDGSRVIGTSRDSWLDFSSDTLGELKLPLEKIRTIEALARQAGVLLECGPGKVLTGLNRRIARDAACLALEDPAGIEALSASTAGCRPVTTVSGSSPGTTSACTVSVGTRLRRQISGNS